MEDKVVKHGTRKNKYVTKQKYWLKDVKEVLLKGKRGLEAKIQVTRGFNSHSSAESFSELSILQLPLPLLTIKLFITTDTELSCFTTNLYLFFI